MTLQAVSDQQDGLLLPGLDGSNPLGFLAALGLFQVVDKAYTSGQTKLQWIQGAGTWIPSIVGTQLGYETLLDLLDENLAKEMDKHPLKILSKLKSDEPSQRMDLFQQSVNDSSSDRRNRFDWLAALASNIIPSSTTNQLQTTRRDYYYGNLKSVVSHTTREHLQRAIFSIWDYADALDNQSLHLDPSEDRRHAYQWNKPAGDPDRKDSGGMLGANRLAIEAIIWFTSLPEGATLHTVGFTGQRSYNTRWTWPIWNVPISVPTVRSALMLAELQDENVSAEAKDRLRRRGIVAAFRTARILVGKTPNFTPAQRIT